MDARECERCGHASSVTSTAVECELPGGLGEKDTVARFASSATCVRAEALPESLQRARNAARGPLVVVDPHMRFLGFLPPESLDAWSLAPQALSPRAGERARGRALVVAEHVTVHDALLALAAGGGRILAVVDDAGALQGVARDLDLLRAWASQRKSATTRLG